jgi:Mn-dependent DtxR family transcriptional regulator
MEEARYEVDLALKVAVLTHHEVPRAEIAERLNISPSQVKAAIGRLRKIAPQLERGD